MSDTIRIEEVDAVTPPPRARVEDAIEPRVEDAVEPRQRDYLSGFLQQKPQGNAPGEPGDPGAWRRNIGKLREARPWLPEKPKIFFAYETSETSGEDRMNVAYLMATAEEAGYPVELIAMSQIGWDVAGDRVFFVPAPGQEHKAEPIDVIFMLYPWEWFWHEEGGKAFFRNMADPHSSAYPGAQPDTYQGQYWDNFGEPHNNDGPYIYWYYLLCQGGSGTKRSIFGGSGTMATCSRFLPGPWPSRKSSAMLRLGRNGNGCAGSIAMGVRTGKTFSSK